MRILVAISALVALVSLPALRTVQEQHTPPDTAHPTQVQQYEVFEFTIDKDVDYGTQQNIRDVTLVLDFTDPGGTGVTTIEGFYYLTRTDGTSLWKARFTTAVLGTWTYTYTLTHVPSSAVDSGSGKFEVIPGSSSGFLRIHSGNPFRWVRDDGSPFVPLGINWAAAHLDGGDVQGAFGGPQVAAVDPDLYLAAMGGAGVNMMRFKGQRGHDGLVDAAATTYFPNAWVIYDERMQKLRQAGFRILYGILGNRYGDGQTSPMPPAQKELIRRSVARWGAYVDVWELQNEKTSTPAWVSEAARYVNSIDPYGHPVTQSHPTPDNPDIDVNAPHWFEDERELGSDAAVTWYAPGWKAFGKPVLVGEQGHRARSWQPNSALRMRIRTWTAFFNEISLFLFPSNGQTTWSASASNIWIGPEERLFLQTLQRFSETVIRTDTAMMDVTVSRPADMRGYGLTSSDGVALYLHHHSSYATTLSGASVTFTSPAAGQGIWIDPATGGVLRTEAVVAGANVLAVPDVVVDIAFFSTAGTLDVAPVISMSLYNTQWPGSGGDLDGDGHVEIQPAAMPVGAAPLTLDFDAGASSDWDGGALTYSWDFGDGDSASGATVSHTFERGSYVVLLTATDDEGAVATHRFAVRPIADLRPDINDAPVWHTAFDVTVRAGNIVDLGGFAFDRELISGSYANDAITYTASNLPAGAQFLKLVKDEGQVDQWNRFWWVPGLDQAGEHTVRFDVQDATGDSPAPLFINIAVLRDLLQESGILYLPAVEGPAAIGDPHP